MTLDELQALADAATPGPWQHTGAGNVYSRKAGGHHAVGFTTLSLDDADFIAACRTEVPKLIAEVRRLRYDNKNWLAAHWGGLFADGKISAQEHDSRIAKLEEATGET